MNTHTEHQALDLKKFCAVNDIRTYLNKPWRWSGGIGASNAHLVITIPDDGTLVVDEVTPTVASVMDDLQRRMELYIDWIPSTSIVLPELVACRHCEGQGFIRLTTCKACDGNGSFINGNHQYDCLECLGSGRVYSRNGTETETCWSCDGSGESLQSVGIYGINLQRRYIAQVQQLPNSQISVGDKASAVLFTFDGGWGAIMPLRY